MRARGVKKKGSLVSTPVAKDRKELNELLGRKQTSSLGEKMLASLILDASDSSQPALGAQSRPGANLRSSDIKSAAESLPEISEEEKVKPRYPYRRHCRSDMLTCYKFLPDIDQDSDERFRTLQAHPVLWESARRILRAKYLEDERSLEEARRILITEQILNLFILDVQATNVPVRDGSKIAYPSLIQISLFHPLTGRHFNTYLTPCKPISYEVGLLSGVYNSIEAEFALPDLDETCSPVKLSNIGQKIYANYSLLERPEIRDRAEYYFEMEKLDPNVAIDLALQEFLGNRDSTSTNLVVLDDLDRDEGSNAPARKAPLFLDVIEDILQFLNAGADDRSTTVLMAHNCNLWAEPLLKAEFERYCSTASLNKIVFLDSGDIYSRIYAREQISPENFSRLLGDKRKEGFNTVGNVLELWSNIKYVSLSIFGRQDTAFLFSKLVEELFLAKKG
jgi:hypothetical protein